MTSILDLLKSLFFMATGIIGIGLLIGLHEFGHFIFCKIFNIKTPSFSIGMGPKIFKKKIGDTVFSLSALPLGGYVEIAGLAEVGQGEQEEAARSDQYSFSEKPYWQKMLVMFGGILFNMLTAYVFFIILFMTGIPKTPLLFPSDVPAVVETVMKDSPAQKAGLQKNDKILAINDQLIDNITELNDVLKKNAGKQVNLTVERVGDKVKLETELTNKGILGIQFQPTELKYMPKQGFFESIKNGIAATNLTVVKTVGAFKSMFERKTMDGVGGPLLIISETMKGAQKGLKIFLILLALISVNLAILNLIPIPIMDGGQILFTTIEAIIRRPIPDQIRLVIHYICWIGVLLLALYLTIEDIRKIFFG